MSTALAVVETQAPDVMGGFALARYITEQARPIARLAELYVNGGLVPRAIANATNPVGACFTVLTTGMELGIPPATALRTVHVIEGRASLSADLMAGLAMQVGVSFDYIQNDATVCKIRWTRGKSTGIVKFDIDEARSAGLLAKDNWKKYPSAMLAARAKANAARQSAPDRLAGCYTPDEIYSGGDSMMAAEPSPSPITSAGALGTSTPSPAPGTAGAPEAGVDGSVPSPAPAVASVERTAQDDPMQNSTRQRLMGLAKALGCTGTAEVPQANGSTRTSTTIVLDEAMAARIGMPGAAWVALISLTNTQGKALVDEMEERRALDDAGAATGGEHNG